MVIKLIQIDCEDPAKITLSSGEHLFGRGKLLGCDDKRISRNHGELRVLEDHIEIKALHQNPCFYTKKGSEEKEILKKDSVINLSNGDRFGLLPDAFWYEVVKCINGSQATVKEDANTEEYIEQTLNPDETRNDNAESPSIIPNASDTVLNTNNSSVQSNLSNNDSETTKVTVKRTHSIEQSDSIIENNKKFKTDSVEVKDDLEIGPTVVQTAPTGLQAATTEGQIDATIVKTEPVEVKTEPTQDTSSENNDTEAANVKQESNDAVGPSGNQANNDGAVNNNARTPRERCMYGANCYRRNPAHFTQFSHPNDADWGAGVQAPCPFGAACGRRDPRHYRDHTHPPGHRPPPPPGKIRKRRGSSYSPPPGVLVRIQPKRRRRNPSSCSGTPYSSEDTETSEEECNNEAEAGKREWRGSSYSPPPGVIVRLRRKHLRRFENYEFDDESDEFDPFDTDGSDEWEPEK
ncbi:aprataxin and PNK-like factor isoform X1 [Aricia agestis]|uniref:aprataxin and PNK-like factor isoform X1 n=1 Tax=Aricia agestis TaxID=91739 RepID=UPI001C204B88|nr:aprataxin and PNK-like factor isoform X1 [Aricia agestis]